MKIIDFINQMTPEARSMTHDLLCRYDVIKLALIPDDPTKPDLRTGEIAYIHRDSLYGSEMLIAINERYVKDKKLSAELITHELGHLDLGHLNDLRSVELDDIDQIIRSKSPDLTKVPRELSNTVYLISTDLEVNSKKLTKKELDHLDKELGGVIRTENFDVLPRLTHREYYPGVVSKLLEMKQNKDSSLNSSPPFNLPIDIPPMDYCECDDGSPGGNSKTPIDSDKKPKPGEKDTDEQKDQNDKSDQSDSSDNPNNSGGSKEVDSSQDPMDDMNKDSKGGSNDQEGSSDGSDKGSDENDSESDEDSDQKSSDSSDTDDSDDSDEGDGGYGGNESDETEEDSDDSGSGSSDEDNDDSSESEDGGSESGSKNSEKEIDEDELERLIEKYRDEFSEETPMDIDEDGKSKNLKIIDKVSNTELKNKIERSNPGEYSSGNFDKSIKELKTEGDFVNKSNDKTPGKSGHPDMVALLNTPSAKLEEYLKKFCTMAREFHAVQDSVRIYNRGVHANEILYNSRRRKCIRQPIKLAVIIDISGSMDPDVVHEAVSTLLGLQFDVDRNSIVYFYSTYLVKKVLLSEMTDEAIPIGGGTDMAKALIVAANDGLTDVVMISDFGTDELDFVAAVRAKNLNVYGIAYNCDEYELNSFGLKDYIIM